jgi:NTE family protein
MSEAARSIDRQRIDAEGRGRSEAERALVLGGGGSSGNAWSIGVIAGLFDSGLDATEADLIIGTSAGSTTAAQVTAANPADLLGGIVSAEPPTTDRGPEQHPWA